MRGWLVIVTVGVWLVLGGLSTTKAEVLLEAEALLEAEEEAVARLDAQIKDVLSDTLKGVNAILVLLDTTPVDAAAINTLLAGINAETTAATLELSQPSNQLQFTDTALDADTLASLIDLTDALGQVQLKLANNQQESDTAALDGIATGNLTLNLDPASLDADAYDSVLSDDERTLETLRGFLADGVVDTEELEFVVDQLEQNFTHVDAARQTEFASDLAASSTGPGVPEPEFFEAASPSPTGGALVVDITDQVVAAGGDSPPEPGLEAAGLGGALSMLPNSTTALTLPLSPASSKTTTSGVFLEETSSSVRRSGSRSHAHAHTHSHSHSYSRQRENQRRHSHSRKFASPVHGLYSSAIAAADERHIDDSDDDDSASAATTHHLRHHRRRHHHPTSPSLHPVDPERSAPAASEELQERFHQQRRRRLAARANMIQISHLFDRTMVNFLNRQQLSTHAITDGGPINFIGPLATINPVNNDPAQPVGGAPADLPAKSAIQAWFLVDRYHPNVGWIQPHVAALTAVFADVMANILPRGIGFLTAARQVAVAARIVNYLTNTPPYNTHGLNLGVGGDPVWRPKVDHIAIFLERLWFLVQSQPPSNNNRKIVISGAGPSGLLAAIEAKLTRMTNDVVVIESTRSYVREFTFDLTQPTRTLLQDLGLDGLDLSYTNTQSAPCNDLQSFLTKVANALDVRFIFGRSVIGVCDNGDVMHVSSEDFKCKFGSKAPKGSRLQELCGFESGVWSETQKETLVNLVVGAEGPRSTVAASMGWRDANQEMPELKVVEVVRNKPVDVGDLSNYALFFHFAPQLGGNAPCRCPWGNAEGFSRFVPTDGQVLAAPAELTGLATIFVRRWYNAATTKCTCYLEMFFRHNQHGTWTNGREWNPMAVIATLYTAAVPNKPNIDCSTRGTDRLKLQCFINQMDGTSAIVGQLGNPRVLKFDTGISKNFHANKGGTRVVVVGDAARKSYNRLGLGANQALWQVDRWLFPLMRTMCSNALALAQNAANDHFRINLALSSTHFVHVAQMEMYTAHYCPTTEAYGFTDLAFYLSDYRNVRNAIANAVIYVDEIVWQNNGRNNNFQTRFNNYIAFSFSEGEYNNPVRLALSLTSRQFNCPHYRAAFPRVPNGLFEDRVFPPDDLKQIIGARFRGVTNAEILAYMRVNCANGAACRCPGVGNAPGVAHAQTYPFCGV